MLWPLDPCMQSDQTQTTTSTNNTKSQQFRVSFTVVVVFCSTICCVKKKRYSWLKFVATFISKVLMWPHFRLVKIVWNYFGRKANVFGSFVDHALDNLFHLFVCFMFLLLFFFLLYFFFAFVFFCVSLFGSCCMFISTLTTYLWLSQAI